MANKDGVPNYYDGWKIVLTGDNYEVRINLDPGKHYEDRVMEHQINVIKKALDEFLRGNRRVANYDDEGELEFEV